MGSYLQDLNLSAILNPNRRPLRTPLVSTVGGYNPAVPISVPIPRIFMYSCHCEERSDEAISIKVRSERRDCFASLAMTAVNENSNTKSSCPALCRASTFVFFGCLKVWMAGTSPAMTREHIFGVGALGLVRSRRLELPQGFPYSDLNAARLPIPPRPHGKGGLAPPRVR